MPASTHHTPDALVRVVVVRRRQLLFRLGLATLIAGIFQFVTGWPVALAWILAYAAQQLWEHRWSAGLSDAVELSARQSRLILVSLFGGNVIFGAFGFALSYFGGPWGLVCGCLLWSGAILNAAMSSAGSRKALIAWTIPTATYFLSTPLFALYYGAPVGYGFIILFAGLLNALSSIAIWSNAQKRFDAEERERSANHAASHDPETGLPNRLAFEREIAERRVEAGHLVIAALGIDRFAELRGAIGYGLATQMIQEVAARLFEVHGGTIARLSTANLGVIFEAQDMPAARQYAARLQATVATPLQLDGNNVDVGLTIGLADARPGEETGSLLEHASIALDQAHRTKGSITVFEPAKYRNPAANLSLMSDMLRSIAEGNITNHYQPKYDLRTGQLIGVEALVRWRHPERGMIPPDTFIPMAEETGRIRELTIHVLREAMADKALLAERGHVLSFAVNLSGRLLHDDDIAATILEIVGPAAPEVSLEITETSMMENPEKALGILHQLRAAGIEISIDDYGSGLSSLAYLKNIPAHELKIDKAFVIRLDENQRDLLLVRSTVNLAHSLGLRVTAEGVESATTLMLLRTINCNLAQGYHMSRPIPLEALVELLKQGGTLPIAPQLEELRPHPIPASAIPRRAE